MSPTRSRLVSPRDPLSKEGRVARQDLCADRRVQFVCYSLNCHIINTITRRNSQGRRCLDPRTTNTWAVIRDLSYVGLFELLPSTELHHITRRTFENFANGALGAVFGDCSILAFLCAIVHAVRFAFRTLFIGTPSEGAEQRR